MIIIFQRNILVQKTNCFKSINVLYKKYNQIFKFLFNNDKNNNFLNINLNQFDLEKEFFTFNFQLGLGKGFFKLCSIIFFNYDL